MAAFVGLDESQAKKIKLSGFSKSIFTYFKIIITSGKYENVNKNLRGHLFRIYPLIKSPNYKVIEGEHGCAKIDSITVIVSSNISYVVDTNSLFNQFGLGIPQVSAFSRSLLRPRAYSLIETKLGEINLQQRKPMQCISCWITE